MAASSALLQEFLSPECSPATLDLFVVRQAILNALRQRLPTFSGLVLDVGCGYMPYRDVVLSPPSRATAYLGLDMKSDIYRARPDLFWDGRGIPLKDDTVDCAMATEVFEHCPDPEQVMRESLRVLKPGAFLFFTVPFLWPLHNVPYDEYPLHPVRFESTSAELRVRSHPARSVGRLGQEHGPDDRALDAPSADGGEKASPVVSSCGPSRPVSRYAPLRPRKLRGDRDDYRDCWNGIEAREMSHPLAVFAPIVGGRSETFIRRHMRDLLPGRTVVVAGETKGAYGGFWTLDGPLLALNDMPTPLPGRRILQTVTRKVGWRRQENGIEVDVARFLRDHGARTAMGEFLSWSLTWLRVAQRLGIPFFGHAHGCDVSEDLRQAKWRDRYLLYNDAGGIITMSQFSRARLAALGITGDKVHVVPYGVDVPSESLIREERDSVYCLAVGRMVSKKAPILLLDAFRRAATECPRLHLNYVGDGDLWPAAQQFVRAFNLQDRVTFYRGQTSEAVMELMRGADIFVQHSLTDPETGDEEGLPVAILEAMANSLPVVSTRHAGIPEAVSEGATGLLVDEGDSKEMAACLIALARDAKLRRTLGHAGWCVARDRFTWDRERSDLLRILGLGEGRVAN